MPRYVKSIHATKIYGRFDLHVDLQPEINVLFGSNGAGKTTLLHILANVLNGRYERFVYLLFDSIRLELSDKSDIILDAIASYV